MGVIGSPFGPPVVAPIGSPFRHPAQDGFRKLLSLYRILSDGRIDTQGWIDERAADILVKDHEGIYRTIPGGVVAIEGARMTYERSKLFATFQATMSTPSPLVDVHAVGVEHAWSVNGNGNGIYASDVDFDKPVSNNDILEVFIDDAEALTRFYCYGNQLTGSIPDLSANTGLIRFYCYNNQLTGSIPDLSVNTGLTRFYCYNNQLTGSIPDLSANTNLAHFYCYGNQLTGSIPDLSANTGLTEFRCNLNQLTGSIPDLSANTNLTHFYCYNNQLTGSIPDLSANTGLTRFYCYSNQLTGSIPDLSTNTNLTHFYCHYNQLTEYSGAAIPANLQAMYCLNNALSETAVNDILIQCDDAGLGSGFTLKLEDGTNAVPTGAGLTAKNNLIARGASVTTN